jgi:hypothetical protein
LRDQPQQRFRFKRLELLTRIGSARRCGWSSAQLRSAAQCRSFVIFLIFVVQHPGFEFFARFLLFKSSADARRLSSIVIRSFPDIFPT